MPNPGDASVEFFDAVFRLFFPGPYELSDLLAAVGYERGHEAETTALQRWADDGGRL